MMFARRHYKAIAEVLRANKPKRLDASLVHHEHIIDQLANLFAQDSGRFNRSKFIEATGG